MNDGENKYSSEIQRVPANLLKVPVGTTSHTMTLFCSCGSSEGEMFSSRILKMGLVALALSGAAALTSLPAQAGESTGTWRNGMVDGPYGPGWYGPDGTFYGNDRTVRRRAYVRERYRPSYRYAPYGYYRDSYYPPRRSYGYYGERPRPGRFDRTMEERRW